MAKKEKKETIQVQLVDKNSSWEVRRGFFLKGENVGTVDPTDPKVKEAIKMNVIKKVKDKEKPEPEKPKEEE